MACAEKDVYADMDYANHTDRENKYEAFRGRL
jgi:hypothetical protein